MASPAQNQKQQQQVNSQPTPNNLRNNYSSNNKTRAIVSIKDFVGSFGAPVEGELNLNLQ